MVVKLAIVIVIRFYSDYMLLGLNSSSESCWQKVIWKYIKLNKCLRNFWSSYRVYSSSKQLNVGRHLNIYFCLLIHLEKWPQAQVTRKVIYPQVLKKPQTNIVLFPSLSRLCWQGSTKNFGSFLCRFIRFSCAKQI